MELAGEFLDPQPEPCNIDPGVEAVAHRVEVGQQLLKRVVDLTLAVLLVLLLLPVLLMLALMVLLSAAGPVLYVQRRVGTDGRLFNMYKFRTMRPNGDPEIHAAYVRALIKGTAPPHNGVFKLADDPRVTRIGHFLRRSSLDELPQLLNVIRGDMSLVGPRPPLPYEVELYGPREQRRLSVKPGLTGLWQISGRSKLTFQQMVDLDLKYIDQWSIWLDLWILVRTPFFVFTLRGAY